MDKQTQYSYDQDVEKAIEAAQKRDATIQQTWLWISGVCALGAVGLAIVEFWGLSLLCLALSFLTFLPVFGESS